MLVFSELSSIHTKGKIRVSIYRKNNADTTAKMPLCSRDVFKPNTSF